jgi:hypothetical protein
MQRKLQTARDKAQLDEKLQSARNNPLPVAAILGTVVAVLFARR